jgi:hypothetical protein
MAALENGTPTHKMARDRRSWETPELKSVGTVSSVLQGGGGKLTPSPNDPGEIFKPKGMGG